MGGTEGVRESQAGSIPFVELDVGAPSRNPKIMTCAEIRGQTEPPRHVCSHHLGDVNPL